MKNLLLFTALYFVCACACKDKEQSVYEDCCGAEPTHGTELVQTQYPVFVETPDTSFIQLQDTVVEAHIYIPNIFMPDNGIDDRFMIFGGEGVAYVESAVFTGEDGEVFYSAVSFQPNAPAFGWSGLKADGTYHYGAFNYEVTIRFVGGQTKTYTGKACAYKCDDPGFPNDRLPDCFFPVQNNGNGQGDHSVPFNQSCFQ